MRLFLYLFQVNKRLADFGIDAESDIIAATGDGASVMVSFGKKAPFEFIICLNHTINLVVLEVVFPKNRELFLENEESDEEESELESVETVEETFSSTVSKMRAIVIFFRKSPVKNNCLQGELTKQNRKQLELVMFTKTRWNSLVISGKRFLDLLPAVLVTLADLGQPLSWDEENTTLLKNLVEVLEPALIATEALSKSSINIIEGEFIIESLAVKLSKLDSPLGKKFSNVLITKINQRRNTEVISLALYLLNQNALSKTSASCYPYSLETKTVSQQVATKLLERLFKVDDNEREEIVAEKTTDNSDLSFRDSMNQIIADRWGKVQTGHTSEKINTIQKDFRSYDQNHQKSPLLQKLFLALCSIPPTSTQSERNFSLSGNFVTKLRTRLTADHVDMLCFLKSYFLNEVK